MQYFSGQSFPLGSFITEIDGEKGVNFSLFSRRATAVDLCLFIDGKETKIPMFHDKNNDIWHVFVTEVKEGTRYGFRVDGVSDISQGNLFNPQKLLIDPYSYAIEGTPDLTTKEGDSWFFWDDDRDNASLAPKSVITDREFDWEGDKSPQTDWSDTIIYEAHVKGFSKKNPNIPKNIAGTFAGLAHESSIEYLKNLGITAIELLPVAYHVDEPHLQKLGLSNYWGYNTIGHFAVDPTLASDKKHPLAEFKNMVKNLHKVGIEVILDIVFNHTAESGIDGPTLCQRGIDNQAYYWLDENKNYYNWTGCGHSIKINDDPMVLRWVIDCLIYWAEECHVDGFRFDLASLLGRTPSFSDKAAFFSAVTSNAKLSNIKLIAEPWDTGLGGYQLGAFPKPFADWNGQYRDDMRRFILAISGDLGTFVRRFAGSDDIFAHNRLPMNNINFITAHDGFTLHDLVSYNEKHNWDNGEENRDGYNDNISYNHGVEGETSDPDIIQARIQSKKVLLTTLLLSHGIPMILAGDELGHSQKGNNNSYCQDNKITWIDWQKADQDLISFTTQLIKIRKQIPSLSDQSKWWDADSVQWLKADSTLIQSDDWHNPDNKNLQILLDRDWLILININRVATTFLLPEGKWSVLLGTENITLMTDTPAVTFSNMGVCVLQRNIF
ncbi:glycogen debranching protein GlgX [Otariodibacter sp.]|uniref:glycogen debranching protein GlgX n=1 Tax=Otariodibacter sp. TaxID=3030919 RepID=UPI002619AD8C|nr:glycogen debranching protein GlgX [Otariodibacter sp.]